jgi:hypothetical protein
MRVNGGCNEITKTFLLSAPTGNPTSPCDNGDFERGNFQNFTGDQGLRVDNTAPALINWYNSGINLGNSHRIVGAGNDPLFPQIQVPLLGSYSARLEAGQINGPSGNFASRLDYTFIPDQGFNSFCFAYAMVMQDGMHSPSQDPFFRYTLIDMTTGLQLNQITIVATATNNSFFSGIVNGVFFRTWTCECIPIPSNLIGHQIKITFEVSSCDLSGHHGYVYLDGLCEPIESFAPTSCFSFNGSSYCTYTGPISVDGTCSLREDRYQWTICQVDAQGQEFNCKEVDGINNAGVLNISNLYNNNFDCDKDLKIKLETWNSCNGYSVHEEVIQLSCDIIEPAEKLVICTPSQGQTEIILDIKMICNNCTYQWRDINLSGIVFIDPTSPSPTIIVTSPGFYEAELRVTHANGCISVKQYKIYIVSAFLYYNSAQNVCNINNCTISLTLGMGIVSSANSITLASSQKIKHLATGHIYNFNVTEINHGNHRSYEATVVINLNDYGEFEWIPVVGNSNSIMLESCKRTFNVPKTCYIGDLPEYYGFGDPNNEIEWPEIVSPNASLPINRTFCFISVNNNPCTFNAKHWNLFIYQEWGVEIEIEGDVNSCDDIIPWNQGFCWDLKYDGFFCDDCPAPPGVYAFVLELNNCTETKIYHGSFTLVY